MCQNPAAVQIQMCADMVLFSDPLLHFNPEYDIQGLSDWLVPQLGSPKVGVKETCPLPQHQRMSHVLQTWVTANTVPSLNIGRKEFGAQIKKYSKNPPWAGRT